MAFNFILEKGRNCYIRSKIVQPKFEIFFSETYSQGGWK